MLSPSVLLGTSMTLIDVLHNEYLGTEWLKENCNVTVLFSKCLRWSLMLPEFSSYIPKKCVSCRLSTPHICSSTESRYQLFWHRFWVMFLVVSLSPSSSRAISTRKAGCNVSPAWSVPCSDKCTRAESCSSSNVVCYLVISSSCSFSTKCGFHVGIISQDIHSLHAVPDNAGHHASLSCAILVSSYQFKCLSSSCYD